MPKGEEKGDVLGFVQDLIKNVIKLDEEIEVAHHTKSDKEGPWLIHARCLRRDSRNKILLAAPKAIKAHELGKKNVYINDDLHPETRQQHWLLHSKMKEMREKHYLAFIPWSLPRVIRYKEIPKSVKGSLKTYKYSDL